MKKADFALDGKKGEERGSGVGRGGGRFEVPVVSYPPRRYRYGGCQANLAETKGKLGSRWEVARKVARK